MLNLPNLCGGGTLDAIVFCCSTKKGCPYRDEALKRLNILKDDYERVKQSKFKDKRLCYGDLGFCCSLEVDCPRRDAVMRDLGMSPGDYLAFKAKLLDDLSRVSLLSQDSFRKRLSDVVVYKMVGRLVPVNCKHNPIYVLALGNPSLHPVLNIVYWEEVEEDGALIKRISDSTSKIVSIRLDDGLLEELDILSQKKGIPRSMLIREILRRAVVVEKQ